jgi:phage terminase large subunit-like protein
MSSSWPPAILTPVPAELLGKRAELAIQFIETYGIITKDGVAGNAGTPLRLRDWQKDLIRHIYAKDAVDGVGFRHRLALVGMPRKNGKSALASALAVFDLVFGVKGGEVYSIAAEKEQARIVFGEAKKMIEASEELSGMMKLYRDAIEFPSRGSVYRVLSAESYSKEGLNASSVFADEIHAMPNRELFDVMSLSMASRGNRAHMVAITTAGLRADITGNDSIAFSLYQYGQKVAAAEIDDPTFFMGWWEAPESADHKDPETWRIANPGFGDINSEEDFASAVRTTPESEFRRKRINQWTQAKNAWLPAGVWEELTDETVQLLPDDEYVIGFDGSWKNDSTSVMVVILPRAEDDVYRVLRANSWEKDFMVDDDTWVVDKQLVANFVREFATTNPGCRELVCDPTYWQDEMFQWADAGIQVVEYPNTISRTAPATAKLFEGIMSGKIRHNGDGALARHIENCILKSDSKGGARLTKDYRNPKLKIDNAIALMMAYDRASARIEEAVVPQFFV